MSELMYTPASQRDYGTLTCWGQNTIGRQVDPCVFQVVPAAKPNAPSNCTLRTATNHSSDALEVECRGGYDGGLPQRFVLEAYESSTMNMRLNLTSVYTDNPIFRLELADLLPTTTTNEPGLGGPPPTLRIAVYAQNAKGRSEVTVLEDIALNDAEKRTDGSTGISIVPLAALLTGVLLTLGIAILLVIVLAIRRRRDVPHCSDNLGHCTHQLELDSVKQQKISPQPSRPNSMLEINTGDHRYVVAYTLKSVSDCGNMASQSPIALGGTSDHQPDILNTPRSGPDGAPPPAAPPLSVANSMVPRPDALFPLSTAAGGDIFTGFRKSPWNSHSGKDAIQAPRRTLFAPGHTTEGPYSDRRYTRPRELRLS
ncbi:hypothetical protein CBL_07976 [Carabus blaptoides fortunei]